MKPNASRDVGADSSERGAIKHCIILTLVGLAAIAIWIMLPPDDKAAAKTGVSRLSIQKAAAIPTAGSGSTKSGSGAHAGETTQTPFEYFPAQFPTPQGDVEPQPPTF